MSAEPDGIAETIGLDPELILELTVADDREAVAPWGAFLEQRQRFEEHFGRLLGIEAADREQLDRASGVRVVGARRQRAYVRLRDERDRQLEHWGCPAGVELGEVCAHGDGGHHSRQ